MNRVRPVSAAVLADQACRRYELIRLQEQRKKDGKPPENNKKDGIDCYA